MNIKLVTWTNKPIETIYWAFMNMHNKIPDNLGVLMISEEEKRDFMSMLLKQPHQTVLEFVNTVWYLDGVSRAFQQQLTRTRQASYSIQSLRIVDCKNFYDQEDFYISAECFSNPTIRDKYYITMQKLQQTYRELLDMGVKTEDARGILPLNIHSPITVSINLRSLYHLLELRFCENTQEEFRTVANEMKEEMREKLGNVFVIPMVPVCFKTKRCPSPIWCGKYDYEREIKEDVSRWIKG